MLTPAQRTTLKADILADPTLAAMAASGTMSEDMARIYNQPADPSWIVWRTLVEVEEIMRNGMDWTRVDNLTVGKARIWDWMSRLGWFDPSKPNIRAGIDAAWVGTSADLAVRATVYTHCKRSATRAEKLFSTGTGTTEAPATMSFEGLLVYSDVEAALAS